MKYIWLLIALFATEVGIAQKKQITLEDIWKDYTFKVKNVPGFNAMKDGEHYTQLDPDGKGQLIHVYNLLDGKQVKTLFDNSKQTFSGKPLTIEDYAFSSDEQKILLYTE